MVHVGTEGGYHDLLAATIYHYGVPRRDLLTKIWPQVDAVDAEGKLGRPLVSLNIFPYCFCRDHLY